MKIRSVLVLSMASVGALAPSASGAVPANERAAGAAPAATQATIAGKAITPAEASARDLACVQRLSGLTCFNDVATAEKSLAPEAATTSTDPGQAQAPAATSSITVNCGYSSFDRAMRSYENLNFNANTAGWTLLLEGRQIWFDMPDGYNDAMSSYEMREHSGHIAADTYGAGLGPFYPGPTGVGDCDSDMGRFSYGGGTWNNKASSRYRN